MVNPDSAAVGAGVEDVRRIYANDECESKEESHRPALSSSPVQEECLHYHRQKSVDEVQRVLAAGRADPESALIPPCSLTSTATPGAKEPRASSSGAPTQTVHQNAGPHDGRLPRRNPNPPDRAELLAVHALHDVMRSRRLTAKDKLRKIQVICGEEHGVVVRHCLEGIGWNSKRRSEDAPFGRWQHCPGFNDVVNRLTLATSALHRGEPLPSCSEMEKMEVRLNNFM